MELGNKESLLKATLDGCMDMIQVFKAVRNDQNELVDFIWILNNKASEKIYGDVVGKSLLTNNPGVEPEGIFDAFKRVVQTGISELYEVRYDHEQFKGWFMQSAVKLNDGVVTTTTDITERKKAEAQLIVIKERLQATLDSSLYFVQAFEAVRDKNGTIVDFTWIFTNHIWNKHYGDVIGKSMLTENPAVIETGLFDKFIQVTETGIPIDHEHFYSYEQFADQWFHQMIVKMGDGFVLNTEDITERKKSEKEILRLKDEIAQNATEKYHTIFNSIDEGFAIQEVILDESNKVIDAIYREVNEAFSRESGLKDVIGKKAGDFIAHIEKHWLDAMTQVYQTGVPVRLEEYQEDLDRWFTIQYARVGGEGSRFLSTLFNDISDRKREEKRQAYLLKISDTLRLLSDASEIQNAVAAVALDHFQADRCFYSLLEEGAAVVRGDAFHRELNSIVGSYPLNRFEVYNVILETGLPFKADNIYTSEMVNEALLSVLLELQMLSFLNVPVVKAGKVVGVFTVSQRVPRVWTDLDIATASDTAERTWDAVERAVAESALRKTEQTLRAVLQQAPLAIAVIDLTGDIVFRNTVFDSLWEHSAQETLAKTFSQLHTVYHMDGRPVSFSEWPGVSAVTEGMITVGEVLEIVRLNGSRIPCSFHAGPIRDDFGKITGGVVLFRDVSDEWASNEELRKSEERTRTVTDEVPQLIWTNEPGGEATWFNRRWFEYTGLSYPESHGPGWQAVVHPDDAPASADRWQQALSNKTVFDTEYRLRGSDYQFRWFIGRNIPLKDEFGNVVSWFGSATDIHDLKMTEEALQVSRERLRVTMASATDYAIITLGVDGHIEAWNKGAENIFGYREEEVIGQSVDLIFTPEDREKKVQLEELQKAIENGRAEDERWHLRRDGSRFYMSGVITPIYDGQLTGFVKVARDMTGPKAAEEQLRISEERYRISLQSADMGAWDWNVVEDKIRWNDQHFLLLGLEPEDRLLNANYLLQFIHPNDLPALSKALMQAVNETGQYRQEAFRIIREDGAVRWMSGFGRAVAWENGKTARMVGVMFDITARKELEQQKEQFIGIASHELRTPVTSIKAYTEILEERFSEIGDSRSAELMRKMDAQVDRLTSLIYTLLDTTRIAGGRMELQKSGFAIDELITETTEAMRRLAGNQPIVLQLDAKKTVFADRERIRQVLINLLSNAIKYGSGGENILVRSESTDGELTVSVQDYGIGIDETEQKRVFEQFFRASDSTDVSGLGLGLYISATIVHEHHGRIWVKSRKGDGATFAFAIPLADD